jgi:hypothetical protein
LCPLLLLLLLPQLLQQLLAAVFEASFLSSWHELATRVQQLVALHYLLKRQLLQNRMEAC